MLHETAFATKEKGKNNGTGNETNPKRQAECSQSAKKQNH